MSTAKKIWLIISAILILVGLITFGCVMTMLKWDFTKLSTVKYETNDYEINEDFKNILIVTNTADIVFIPSESHESLVVCHEQKNLKHSVTVNEDTLEIEISDMRKWYEHIGINFDTPKITVYIPEGEYGSLSVKTKTGDMEIPKDFKFSGIDISGSTGNVKCYASADGSVKIKQSTGDICVEKISAGELLLSVTTGRINADFVKCQNDIAVSVNTGRASLKSVECKNLFSDGSTGGISLKNVIASEKFSIERDTGDVNFEGCDAYEIFVETDTGDVKGSLLSDKVFIVSSDTGRIDVPETVSGGRCKITTDTGDIKISIQQ